MWWPHHTMGVLGVPVQAADPGLGPLVASQCFPLPLLLPCCVHLGSAAASLVPLAQWGIKKKKAAAGGKQVSCGKVVSCYTGGRSPGTPVALRRPHGSLLLQQSPACPDAVGGWASGAQPLPSCTNGDQYRLVKGRKGQALNGQTNPYPAPLLRGDPSLSHCLLCLSKDLCVLSESLY